jgi:N-acetylglutamate synthase-like GNAT family acetyltransferase
METMSSTQYRVRRATLDDIGQLLELWKTMHLPGEDLARRITEFQIVESSQGQLLGAIGLQISQRQGLIHSEGFLDFALADQLRPLLWERLRSVATNQGLVRFWTREHAPFWSHCGLAKADAEALQKLPTVWGKAAPSWLTLKLRENLEEIISADHEFALFMASEKERTQRAFQRARILKVLATLLALAILILVLVGAFLVVRNNPPLLHR